MQTSQKILLFASAIAITGGIWWLIASNHPLHNHHSKDGHHHDGFTVAGELKIKNAHIRAMAPGATVTGGFLTIANDGESSDLLLSATAEFAAKVEIHETINQNNIMQMRPLPSGLPLIANGETRLAPGGYHIMFMEVKKPVVAGDQIPVILSFTNAPRTTVIFAVQEIGNNTPEHNH